MKKQLIYISAIVAISLFGTVNMQAQAPRETQVTYLKNVTNAFEREFNISKSDLEDIVEAYFKEQFKSKRLKSNGFQLYKGVDWTMVSAEKLDVYYKIEGGKRNAKLIMMVSKGYDNFVSSNSDAQVSAQVINFLNNFDAQIAAHNRQEAAAKLTKEIEKKEKDIKDYDKEEKKLRDKIQDLEKDIERNAKRKAEAIEALEKEKAKLRNIQ